MGGGVYFSHGEYNARGVATLIPEKLLSDFELKEEKSDDNGRMIVLDCKIYETNLILINIYAPTKDHIKEQLTFYENLYRVIEQYSDQNIIIGGDFITYLNINLDKKGGRIETQSLFSQKNIRPL